MSWQIMGSAESVVIENSFILNQNSQPPKDHSPISRKEFVRFLLATSTKSELRCQVELTENILYECAKGNIDSVAPAAFRDLISAVPIYPDSICAISISRWQISAAVTCHMLICAAPIWSGLIFLEPTWM